MAKTPAPSYAVDSVAVAALCSRRRAFAAVISALGAKPDSPLVPWVAHARVAAAVGAELGDPPAATIAEIISARPRGHDAPDPTAIAVARKSGMSDSEILSSLAHDGGREVLRAVREREAQRHAKLAEARQAHNDAAIGRRVQELLARMRDPQIAPTADHVRALQRELREFAPRGFEQAIAEALQAAKQRDALRDRVAQAQISKHEEPPQAELAAWVAAGREARGAERVAS